MKMFALIPCSKLKADRRCAARELYAPSSLFSGALRTAETRRQLPIVLSAKYGAVKIDEALDPYDETLNGKPKREREAWARIVFDQLQLIPISAGDVAVSYLGANYGEFLVPWLRASGVAVEEPLKGLGQGKRLTWFSQQEGGKVCQSVLSL